MSEQLLQAIKEDPEWAERHLDDLKKFNEAIDQELKKQEGK